MIDGRAELADPLLSYVPRLALRGLVANDGALEVPSSEQFPAAVLFADIVGSSALTERLNVQGPIGVEQLSAHLNAYFGRLIDLVMQHGGDVYRFAGDAMLAIWPVLRSGDALDSVAVRAARCALAIQALSRDYQLTPNVRVSVRVSIGCGDVVAAHLGGVSNRCEFVLFGDPVLQAAGGSQQAQPGEVIVSPALLDLCGEHLLARRAAGGRTRLVGVTLELPLLLSEPAAWPSTVLQAARRYVLPSVLDRLDSGQTDWVAELRRVTAMFVNVDGIDSLAPNATDLLQQVTVAVQVTLADYEGSLCQLVVADKGVVLHCVFGLPPFAHDDDPERGARAALALSDELGRQRVRSSIGVATGTAFCGPIGSARRREYNLLGSAVNLAAALAVMADGDVLCDTETRGAAQARLAFEPRPAIRAKGHVQPVAVFRPLEQAPPPAEVPLRGRGVVIGRLTERRLLRDTIDVLATQHASGAAIIEAEAGMGKSRLIAEILDHARLRGIATLVGAAEPVERTTPYYALRTIFRDLIGDSIDAVRRSLVDEPGAEATLEPLLPLLNPVLGLALPDSDLTRIMTSEAGADYTRELLVQALQRATRANPLLVVVEDAHWLDSASWALLRRASDRVQSLILVLAMRPPAKDIPAELRQLLAATTTRHIRLGALSPAENKELACQRLDVDSLPPAVESLVWERTEGHPLYTKELISALRDTGVVIVRDGHASLARPAADIGTLPFPPTLQGAITARIDRLTPSQQLLLKVASVIGRQFSLAALRAVYPPGGQHDVAADLQVLDKLELTQRTALEPEPQYAFRHMLTQDVAYNLMLFAQRRQLHRAIAEWYETNSGPERAGLLTLLAHHWTQVLSSPADEPVIAERAVGYLERAAQQATSIDAHLEAVRLYEEALRLDDLRQPLVSAKRPATARTARNRRALWERQLGESCFRIGQADNAIRHLRQSLALLGHPLADNPAGLAVGALRDGVRLLLRQVWPATAQRPAPTPERHALEIAAEVYASLSLYTFIRMQELDSIGALLRGQNLAEQTGPSSVLVRTSYQTASFLLLLFGSRPLFERYMRRAHQIAAAGNDPASEAQLWFGRGVSMISFARWQEAESATLSGQELFARVGDRRWVDLSTYQLANIAHFQGQLDTSLGLSRKALASAELRGDAQMQAWLLIQQAHVLVLLGQDEAALAALDDADQRLATSFTELADPAAEFWASATRAAALAHLGNAPEALAAAQSAAGRIKPYLNFMYYSARGFGDLADASVHLWANAPPNERHSSAIRRLAETGVTAAAAFAQRSPFGRAQALLWRGRRLALMGQPEQARRVWLQAIAAADQARMPYEGALAHLQLGQTLAGTDEHRREHLSEARVAFNRMGAARLAQRTQELLDA